MPAAAMDDFKNDLRFSLLMAFSSIALGSLLAI
jgi:hypothetical protein